MTYSLEASSLTIVLQCPPLKFFILLLTLFPASATDKDSLSYFFLLDFYTSIHSSLHGSLNQKDEIDFALVILTPSISSLVIN